LATAALYLISGFLFAAGCTGAASKQEPQARLSSEIKDQSEHHEHDHEHHDHEHHDPEHKPKSFPEAVERLRGLRSELAERSLPKSEEWEIAVDIVDWLPELAAESELNEREWNRVESNASELRLLLLTRERDAVRWERFDLALEKLNESVADYRAAEARFMRPLKDADAVPTPEGE
jgi:ABC-type Zn2+ transport system substrate-binding protein/surface adhesin